jgi:hypothetical protein
MKGERKMISAWPEFAGQNIKFADMTPEQRKLSITVWRVLAQSVRFLTPGYAYAVTETLRKALAGELDHA